MSWKKAGFEGQFFFKCVLRGGPQKYCRAYLLEKKSGMLVPVFVCGCVVGAVEPSVCPCVEGRGEDEGGECDALCGCADDGN